MPKPLLQGKLGYWVDGKLVHMPSRANNVGEEKKEFPHEKRNRKHKEQVQARQEMKRRAVFQYVCHLELLKNASKSGNIQNVVKVLSDMFGVDHPVRDAWSTRHSLRRWTRPIFVPDMDKRSALYYASLTGNAHIVELYLDLYLLSCAKITKTTATSAYTFREWFHKLNGTAGLGLGIGFTMKEYDLCVLNALNAKVKNMFTKKRVTIYKSVNRINTMSKSWNFNIPGKVAAAINELKQENSLATARVKMNTSKKTTKPQLNCSDELDLSNIDEFDYWNDEDDIIDDEHDMIVDSDEQCTQDSIVDNGMSISHLSSPEIVIQDNIISDLGDEYSYTEWQNLLQHYEAEFNKENDEFDLIPDIREGQDKEDSSVGWDIVSDVQSVISVDTFATTTSKQVAIPSSMSYRDAILKVATSPAADLRNNAVSKAALKDKGKGECTNKDISCNERKPMRAITEEDYNDDDFMQDVFWDRDGFKYARGGGYKYK